MRAEIKLGEPKIAQIDIPNHHIEIGQWILLYGEIPMRKISETEYEVYADAELTQVKTWEEEMEERAKILEEAFSEQRNADDCMMGRLSLDAAFNELMVIEDYAQSRVKLEETPKYVKKGHGSKRLRPWESPRYFG